MSVGCQENNSKEIEIPIRENATGHSRSKSPHASPECLGSPRINEMSCDNAPPFLDLKVLQYSTRDAHCGLPVVVSESWCASNIIIG